MESWATLALRFGSGSLSGVVQIGICPLSQLPVRGSPWHRLVVRHWGRLPNGGLLSFPARTGQAAGGPISVFSIAVLPMGKQGPERAMSASLDEVDPTCHRLEKALLTSTVAHPRNQERLK